MNTSLSFAPNSRPLERLAKLLRCATLEQCREIQKGSLFLRRICKMAALGSIGLAMAVGHWVNFFQEKAIAYMDEYDRMANSKPLRWLYTAPPTDWIRDLIRFYNGIDTIQTALLISVTIYTVRWAYADSVVRGQRGLRFGFELTLILVVNFLVYFTFSSWWFYQLILKIP